MPVFAGISGSIRQPAHMVVMDAPPDKERVEPFIHIADIFGRSGVAVPRVLAKNIEKGFLLLSDLGVTTYLNELNDETANRLYLDAIDALISIQSISQPDILPEYDRAALLPVNWNFSRNGHIGKHLNVQMSEKQKAELDKVFRLILANNLSQPQVFVHRDYHSRNLMRLGQNDNNPGILDFQDALFGPITYDLVSLLKDAYIEWDEEKVLDWVIRYWEKAKRIGLPVNPDIDLFYRDFEFMGIQRHLKVLGIFAVYIIAMEKKLI